MRKKRYSRKREICYQSDSKEGWKAKHVLCELGFPYLTIKYLTYKTELTEDDVPHTPLEDKKITAFEKGMC